MIKLDGKYSLDLGLDFANVLGDDVEYGLYNNKPAIFVGFNADNVLNNLELVERKYINSGLFEIYLKRELTEEESRMKNGLDYIIRSFPDDISSNLRISLTKDIDGDTINNSRIFSTYKIGEKDFTIYDSPRVNEKILVKE